MKINVSCSLLIGYVSFHSSAKMFAITKYAFDKIHLDLSCVGDILPSFQHLPLWLDSVIYMKLEVFAIEAFCQVHSWNYVARF